MLIHPAELPVYSRYPLRPVRGEGCTLFDAEGNEYLDFYAGHAVALTGHRHPRVVAAIEEELGKLLFYSNALPLDVRDRFFSVLADLAPEGLAHLFLVNSGAEANEQAIHLARRATGRSRIVTMAGGFHGRTLATLAVSGIPRYRGIAMGSEAGRAIASFTDEVPLNDADRLSETVTRETAAVLLEPVQGLAGAFVADPAFLVAAREICDRSGAALLFDEVQTGCGRTGAFTRAQACSVAPDAITLAKGIAAGLPVGAVLVNEYLAEGLGNADLGTTFGGGPLPCAAAAANLSVLIDENLMGRASALEARLRAALAEVPGVIEVRGEGLLLGVVLDRPAKPVRLGLYERGLLTGAAIAEDTVRLLPPLVLRDDEADRLATELKEVLS